MKGLVCFNYGGSGTIGAMQAGIKIDKVLEISDEMINNGAAKHFMYNYPEIPVLSPTIWENDEYLEKLADEKYDIMMGWPPCSGLSQINRNANVDNDSNQHFFRYFNVVSKVKPKTFIVENAPTLIKIGKPILDKMIKILPEYNFTFIRDFGMNHSVAMKRQRTFIVGWRKDIFEETPIVEVHKNKVTVKDIIGDLYNMELDNGNDLNFKLVENRTCKEVEWLIPDVPVAHTINLHICNNYEKYEERLSEKFKKSLSSMLFKVRNGKRYWDKSPVRVSEDYLFPSMASVVEIIHPIHDRQLTIREYARIMGYPDTYIFVDDCETPIIQCIAQGVPAEYFKWISGEVKAALEGRRKSKSSEVIYQHHVPMFAQSYTKEEFLLTKDVTIFDKEKRFKLEV